MPTEFSILRRVQFADTDMAGIVHFSNYFLMMEEVEQAFLRSLGLSVTMKHAGGEIGFPRAACSCEFFGPIRFEDELELKFHISRLGDKSVSYEVEFMLAGVRVALGKVTAVCCAVGGGKMRSIAIPPDIRAKLSPAE